MSELRRMRPLLGTYVEVAASGDQAESGIHAAFASLAASHAKWSFQDPDSELSQLNARPGSWVRLSGATLRLLRLARGMTAASGGLFNCTVGGTLVRRGVLPDHGSVPLVDRGDAGDIELRTDAARLRRPVRVTLDGIAKGYAVDLAVQALRRAGVSSGWVNAGGDLRVFGDADLPVHRREADGCMTPLGHVRNAALATSQCGRPTTAFPASIVGAVGAVGAVADTETAPTTLWTVLARTGWRADALTKVAATASDGTRKEWVARLGGHLVEPARERQAA
jgi:thiamine biosynthesis lipoprotein